MNAFVASYDLASYEVRFRMESVVNGQILDSDGEFISFSKLSKDPWANEIAVADGDQEFEDGFLVEDEPSLREHLTGILQRRFESVREGAARYKNIFEKSGYKTYAEFVQRPIHAVILHDLERASWDSREAKDTYNSYFKQHKDRPEFDEEGNLIQPAKSDMAPTQVFEDTYPTPMGADAFYGVAGDFVRLVKPETEADPVALLGNFLVAAGLLFSRNAFVVADGKRHHAVEYLLMAGDSGVGRKGTATNRVLPLMDEVEMFYHSRVLSGLSTGEGLIRALTPKATEDPESVKWYLAVIQEFASLLAVMKRENNTMSSVLREAYDGGKLSVLTRKDPLKVDNTNLGVIAHITNEELLNNLTDTDRVNGFANRFLTICVKRWQLLPEGGDEVNLTSIVARLKDAVEKSKGRGRIGRDEAAKNLWRKHYPLLTRKRLGLRGALLSRAETHVLRLSLIYALLDGADAIRVEHLKAALAFWAFVENSVGHIYRNASGDTAADKILAAMADGPLTKTEVRRIFNDNKPSDWVDAKLQSLIAQGLVSKSTKQTGNGTREAWGLKS
jgi:hypothetical protein